MSEYAFYWYMTERASAEKLEDLDRNSDPWPATFEEFVEKHKDIIEQGRPYFTDEIVYEKWRLGIWQEGFLHAIAKLRNGHEDVGTTWWSKEYEEHNI